MILCVFKVERLCRNEQRFTVWSTVSEYVQSTEMNLKFDILSVWMFGSLEKAAWPHTDLQDITTGLQLLSVSHVFHLQNSVSILSAIKKDTNSVEINLMGVASSLCK